MRHIERRVCDEQLHAAGYVAYEAAAGFDKALATRAPSPWPLLTIGLYEAPLVHTAPGPVTGAADVAEEWQTHTPRRDYIDNIGRIRDEIAAGNCYQVNYTIRTCSERVPDPWRLFLRMAPDAPYAAYLETADYAVVSASPELFFRLDGEQLVCRPMKGTARRGMTAAQDRALREQLRGSAKDRAENVMIADMIRNDMGRIARSGSVRADSLFDIEKHATVWQMTSTVSAHTDAGIADIFRALFPCASVTGAPKVASMQLIAALEDTPRHLYTGAIGYIAPRRQAQFSVAIRTAFVDRRDGTGSYGIGGGIVWSSEAAAEYDECMAKARVLYRRPAAADFQLLETLRWSHDEGFFLLERHLDRMRSSAGYFDFGFDEREIRVALEASVQGLQDGRWRVRLLLSRDGSLQTSASELEFAANPAPQSLHAAPFPVDDQDPFVYHKTTWRHCYARAAGTDPPGHDVLFWNRDGYVTESTVANVAVPVNGRLRTPPVDCGLLGGTCRAALLDSGRFEEGRIHLSQLRDGDEIILVNAVRGEHRARFVGSTAAAPRSPGRHRPGPGRAR